MASTLSKDFEDFLIQRIENTLMSLNEDDEYKRLKREASYAEDKLKRALSPLPSNFDELEEEWGNAKSDVICYERASIYVKGFRDGLKLLIGA